MYTPSELLDCSNQFRRISWICLIHLKWTEGNIVVLYVKKMAEAADEGGGASRIFTRADAFQILQDQKARWNAAHGQYVCRIAVVEAHRRALQNSNCPT